MNAPGDRMPKLTAAALFVCTAGSIAGTFLLPHLPVGMSSWDRPLELAAEASPLVFLCAAVLVFLRPRLGYALGLAAGLIALPWLARAETLLHPWNSWIFLNSEEAMGPGVGCPEFVVLRILAPALIVIAVACSLLRLLPPRWTLRGVPLRRRTWPAFAVGFVVLAVWLVRSVTPYGVPGFDHGSGAESRILHVQKRGLRIRETRVMALRDGRVGIWRTDRRLFHYRFDGWFALTSLQGMPQVVHERARALAQSPDLRNLRTPPARALRAWNAEGWYVVLKDSRLLAFTSEYGTKPPQEVTDLFHEIEKLPAREERSIAARDVCLGFCYDPVAALGFSILEQRMRLLSRDASGAGRFVP